MTTNAVHILKDALSLSAKERASLADQILFSLDTPDEHIDALWGKEVEDRIAAYKKGLIKTVSLNDVISKYKK